uniref:Cathepsin S n=1 Tax=Xenopus tropicalis TaxID=8364 RepID=A0A6I8RJG6_XENTR
MGPSSICLVALLSLLIPAVAPCNSKEEERARWTIWEETLKFIIVHNLEYSLGLHTYEVGMNHLGDMTGEEVATTMTGYTGSRDSLANMSHVPKEILEALAPPSIDWRTKGCVTPVKNQGSCKCDYAFAAVGALECQWKIKTGSLFTFSPQELVDCSYTEGNNGCNEGYPMEPAYPYEGKEGKCTKMKPSNTGVVKQFYRIPSGNGNALMKGVGTVGPVSAWIHASQQGFHMYKSGVYYDPHCTTHTNHVVLIVGYGTAKGTNYWLIKTVSLSWGKGYGHKGYIKMARNYDKDCGITQYAYYPTV